MAVDGGSLHGCIVRSEDQVHVGSCAGQHRWLSTVLTAVLLLLSVAQPPLCCVLTEGLRPFTRLPTSQPPASPRRCLPSSPRSGPRHPAADNCPVWISILGRAKPRCLAAPAASHLRWDKRLLDVRGALDAQARLGLAGRRRTPHR